jgi:ABC-type branched-subunit amino acid transport system substrate-binding protein
MKPRRVLLAGSAALCVCACARTVQTRASQPPTQPPADTGLYAGTPPELSPYSRFDAPYTRFFKQELVYRGYGRQIPEPEHVDSVKIGFLAPIIGSVSQSIGGPVDVPLRVNEAQTTWDGYAVSHLAPIGIKMLQGARLAVAQANARGGYRGKIPFQLVVRNDNGNWRSAGDEVIRFAYVDSVWAILGSVDGQNTHVAIRVALKIEIPVMMSGDTDPTAVETNIPWAFRNVVDDRQMCYLLADFVFRRLGLERVAALRAVNRYGRVNIDEFRDGATRLGHPLLAELSYREGDTLFTSQLERIKSLNPQAVFTYGNSRESALILKQMRAMGMDQWFLGSDRMVTQEFIDIVGPDAGRVAAGYPWDPTRQDPRHLAFVRDFTDAYGEAPETYAAYAYDGMMMLMQATERAGLNRALIRDSLAAMRTYDGVTGTQHYDRALSNRGPATLAVLESGRWEFYGADEMPAPAARPGVLDRPVEFGGWRGTTLSPADLPEVRIGLFAPDSGDAPKGARLAVEQRNAAGGFRGTPLRLVERWSRDPWSGGAREMVRLVYDDSVWAVLGSVNGDATHVAEQVVTKARLPLVAPLSADPTLTHIRIPWIFRLPPDEAAQAEVLVRDGALARSLAPVGLITSSDHDGRTFANAVLQRLHAAGMAPAFHFEIALNGDLAALAARALSFQPGAVIVRVPRWGMPDLLDRLSAAGMRVPLLVPWIPGLAPSTLTRHYGGDVLAVRPFRELNNPAYAAFARAYRARYGSEGTPSAAYGYDAVNLLAGALETSGLNRAALREAIAAQRGFVGATGTIAWDNAGGNRAEPVLLVLPGATRADGAAPPSAADPGRASRGRPAHAAPDHGAPHPTRGLNPW